MKPILFLISGAVIALIAFLVYKFFTVQIEKERKIAEELSKMDNGEELLRKRRKYTAKRMIIVMLGFYLCLGLIVFVAAVLVLHKINTSP